MNREEICRESKKYHSQKFDDVYIDRIGKSSRISLILTGIFCLLIFLVNDLTVRNSIISTCSLGTFAAMMGISELCLYHYLKEKNDLLYGVVSIAIAVLYFLIMFFEI